MLNEIHIQGESRDDPHQLDMLIFYFELHFEFRSAELLILNKILRADSYEIYVKALNIHWEYSLYCWKTFWVGLFEVLISFGVSFN